MEEEKTEGENKTNQWIKDNLRVIVSVAAVILIAAGIYSYSKRTEPEQITMEEATEETTESQKAKEQVAKTEETKETQPTAEKEKQTSSAQIQEKTSSETTDSFVEKAVRGEGVTHLARRALANHLEKNPDSSLTPEHKIYIEDYLRKNVNFRGRVFVGTTISFDKDLIREAIENAKKLNDNQLKNLHKYAVMVPSLT